MASKKTLTWIFIAVAVIILALAVYYFFFSGPADPNKTNTPVPPGSPTPKWVPETFPLNVGMYGSKIKLLQKALGIAQDGKFGTQTKGAIIAKGYSVPLVQADYNTIINTGGGSAVQNIPGAYAKYDTTIFNLDYSVNRKAKKGEWLGTTSGVSADNKYYELDSTYYVSKDSVILKA